MDYIKLVENLKSLNALLILQLSISRQDHADCLYSIKIMNDQLDTLNNRLQYYRLLAEEMGLARLIGATFQGECPF